jgi:hypothetical protein
MSQKKRQHYHAIKISSNNAVNGAGTLDDWTGNEESFESLLPDRWVKSSVPPSEAVALVVAKVQIAQENQGFHSAIS